MTDDSATLRAIAALKGKIDYRLNECLCEMKPNYDDSIAGFNEAWNIVSEAFATVDLPSQSSWAKADERATLTHEERVREIIRAWQEAGLLPRHVNHAWIIGLTNDFKEADRLAREDAARIAFEHLVSTNGADAIEVRDAIRASITTDEGKT